MAPGRRKTGRLVLLLALLMIGVLAVAAFLLRDQLFPGQTETATISPDQGEMVRIVILAQPVNRDTVLTSDVLTTISYPKKEMVEGLFFTDINSVLGLHSKYDLPQGTPLIRSQLTDKPLGSQAALQIPPGMVAMAIPMNRMSSMAYGLKPGDHVNIMGSLLILDLDAEFQTRLPNFTSSVVLPGTTGSEEEGGGISTATITITSGGLPSAQGRTEIEPTLNQAIYVSPSESQRARLVAQTLVQDVLILWIGEFPKEGILDKEESLTPTATPPPSNESGESQVQSPRPDIMTVVVTPQDAITLYWLMQSGVNLNMVLRSAGDHQLLYTEAATTQFIMDQYAIPYPAKLPYGLEPRQDILSPSQLFDSATQNQP